MNRKERRANPDQWWKLVAQSLDRIDLPELPDEYAQYVKGSIGDVLVVALPNLPPSETVALVKGVRELCALMDRQVVVVPDAVKFCRFRPVVNQEQIKKLDGRLRNSQLAARARAAIVDKGDEPS